MQSILNTQLFNSLFNKFNDLNDFYKVKLIAATMNFLVKNVLIHNDSVHISICGQKILQKLEQTNFFAKVSLSRSLHIKFLKY